MGLHTPVLISSPSRHEIHLISSSPNLPSLDTLLKKPRYTNPLKPRSRAAAIPSGAASGFQSARLLQREVVEDDVAAEKPRKRRKRSDESEGSGAGLGREKKKADGVGVGHGERGKGGSPRLGRYVFEATEVIEEAGGGSPTRRVERRVARRGSEDAAPRMVYNMEEEERKHQASTETIQETHSGSPTKPVDPRKASEGASRQMEGNTDEEQKRRTASTDTNATTKAPATDATSEDAGVREKPSDTDIAPRLPELDFRAAWSYTGPGSKPDDPTTDTKAVNLESQPQPEPEVEKARSRSPQKQAKPKAPTKSSRTVTSIAIARYQDASGNDDGEQSKSDAFWDQSETARARKLLEPVQNKQPKGKGKAATKPPIKQLPNPEAAQARVERQEFFFGTSSQLTRDEPTEHVRDLQRAIKASEAIDDFVPQGENLDTPKRGLWASGSRGEGLPLLEAETIARRVKVYSPKKSLAEDIPSVSPGPRQKLTTISTSTTKGVLHSISLNLISPTKKSQTKTAPSKSAERAYSTSSVKKDDSEKPQKKPRGRPRKDGSAPGSPRTKSVKSKKPKLAADAAGDTTQQTTKIAKDGKEAEDARSSPQKKPKKRSKKVKRAGSDAEPTPGVKPEQDVTDIDDFQDPPDDAANESTKSDKRRKPKKKSKKVKRAHDTEPTPGVKPEQNVTDIDDFQDSASDAADNTTKAGKRRKPRVSQKKEREDFIANKAAILFPAITNVVKSQIPDRQNPKSLTWYEKMLLYDPIVLEDLTAWLKTTSLQGEQQEHMPLSELKPWMVQLWCEEHSVCCLYKEGLRGGVKLKY